MNFPNHSFTNLQKDITISRYNLKVMLLLSGFIIVTGLSTIMVLRHVLSGDSIIQRQEPITPQLIHQK